ncbi:MAG: hypothetical protein HY907_08825 [Deltaproteobacteria bacterium]|nr:hypothetical protein [Deltaproteobacteria bacterium]
MAQAAIRSTVTQKVRGFLVREGVPLAPWTKLDDIYGELYGLMNRRRDDPAFWPPVARLLDDIVADVTDPASPRRLPAPQAELLSSWDVSSLVSDLRRSLPGGEVRGDPTTVRRFGQKLAAQMLGGFLLLGLAAAGCNEEDGDILPDGGDAADVADEATSCPGGSGSGWSESCALDSSSVLWCTIATSGADLDDRGQLCTCFAALNESWRTGLAALFATEDAATVARALGEMMTCVCPNPTFREGAYQDPVHAPTPTGSLCEPAPAYKGVSFER